MISFFRKKQKKYLIPTKGIIKHINKRIEESFEIEEPQVDSIDFYVDDIKHSLSIWNNAFDSNNRKNSIDFMFDEDTFKTFEEFRTNCKVNDKVLFKELQLIVSFPNGTKEDYDTYQLR